MNKNKIQKGCPTGGPGKKGRTEIVSALPDNRYGRLFEPMGRMWISKEEWDEINKKIAGLEARIYDQQKIILSHIQEHEESVTELKQIVEKIKVDFG